MASAEELGGGFRASCWRSCNGSLMIRSYLELHVWCFFGHPLTGRLIGGKSVLGVGLTRLACRLGFV
jgi:hypothetical protein